MKFFKTSQRILISGINPDVAPALLALLIQGSLPRSEFETFTGLRPDEISDQMNSLRNLGIVDLSSHVIGRVEPKLTLWFANEILPGLLEQK